MTGVGVVVVLFRPDDVALANLERARADCPNTVVVDNTPDPSGALHDQLRESGLQVVDNRNRGGLAGAYNRGVTALLDRGCELCFLLDQDSEIEAGFFDRMAQAAHGLTLDAYLIGPRIFEIEMGAYLPDWSEWTSGVHPVEVLISSGSAVSAAAFAQLGEFREDFFIDWIDMEYSMRAARHGVPLFADTSETLRQRQGVMTRHGTTFTTNHPAWRRYYHVRNGIWTSRKYWPRSAALRGAAKLVLRELWVALRHEPGKRQKAAAIVCAALDGARGRLGTFEERWPTTCSYCSR